MFMEEVFFIGRRRYMVFANSPNSFAIDEVPPLLRSSSMKLRVDTHTELNTRRGFGSPFLSGDGKLLAFESWDATRPLILSYELSHRHYDFENGRLNRYERRLGYSGRHG